MDYRVTCGRDAVDFDGYHTEGSRGVLLDAKYWQPKGDLAWMAQRELNGASTREGVDLLFNSTVGSLNKQAELAHRAGLDLEWHFAFRETRDLLVRLCLRAGWRESGRDRHARWVDLTYGYRRVRVVHTAPR
jgi:hypothetical protein